MSAALTESGHWYTRTGEPRYTVPYADPRKGERPTTLKDARKERLVPSVTTIEKVIAAPQLENWKARQVLLAAATLPRDPSWTDDEWIAAVEADAKEQAKAAADKGSAIHGMIEAHLCGHDLLATADDHKILTAVDNALRDIDELESQWSAEESFAHPMGFGGKVDASHPGSICGDAGNVVDFKTKEFTEDDIAAGKVRAWDNHARQLAAYREGLKMPRAACYNIFISTINPGLVHIVTWSEEDIRRGWEQFQAALALWKSLKGYDPGVSE